VECHGDFCSWEKVLASTFSVGKDSTHSVYEPAEATCDVSAIA